MKKILLVGIAACMILGFSSSVNALLIDRGGGMIYSTDMDITILQDAKWAVTSGYDTDGYMTWESANSWTQNLLYGGYNDWRLPTFDPNYNRNDVFNDLTTAAQVSEMAYLRYVELGPIYGSSDPFDPSPFVNLIDSENWVQPWYWSGTTFNDPSTGELLAWRFDFECG